MKFFSKIFAAIGQSRQMQAERMIRDHAHLLAQYEAKIVTEGMNAVQTKIEPTVSMTMSEFKVAA